MKNILKTILFCILLSGCKKDKNFTFKGKVTDSETGKPVANANVYVVEERTGTGYFSLGLSEGETVTNIEGNYTIKIEKKYENGHNYIVFVKSENYADGNTATNYADKAPATFVNDFTLQPKNNVVALKVISAVTNNSKFYCFQDSLLLDKVGKEKYFYSKYYKNNKYEFTYAIQPLGAEVKNLINYSIITSNLDTTFAELEIK